MIARAPEDFGPFAYVFERGTLDVPGYLTLLHLGFDDCEVAIRRIANALDHPTAPHYISMLLEDRNWRPNLVGAMAVLIAKQQDLVSGLWNAVDAASWVNPQLAAVASVVDRDFITNSAARFDACGISSAETAGPRTHCAPVTVANKPKTVGALLPLLRRHIPDSPWLTDLRVHSVTDTLLKSDIDDAGGIACHWIHCALQRVEHAIITP